ncbi:TniQ family protein [Cytobacillus oceanisediminis]|uniref:TniQ family protein n=1 Tax=Cytobacillus oceanisediminis TaxID=665099 RepID=UPI0020796BF1|nr:TniQ family protein [Cytobacillus oceanisediminis]USK44094.1 TniQ family protein [Cytobacillus oceanisediminis]
MTRSLGIRPLIMHGESLTSYLLRACKANHILYNALIKSCSDIKSIYVHTYGLIDILPHKYVNLVDLCSYLGLSNKSLKLMTMTNLLEKFCGEITTDNVERYINKVFRLFDTKYRRYCPYCLKVNPTFKLIWQIKDIEICEIHNEKLLSFCIKCGEKIKYISKSLIYLCCDNCNGSLITRYSSINKLDATYIDNQKRLINIYNKLLFCKQDLAPKYDGFTNEQSIVINILFLTQDSSKLGKFQQKNGKILTRTHLIKLRDFVRGCNYTNGITVNTVVEVLYKLKKDVTDLYKVRVSTLFLNSLKKEIESFEIGPCLSPWCKFHGSNRGMLKLNNRSIGQNYKNVSLCQSCSLIYGLDKGKNNWIEIKGMINLILNLVEPKLKEEVSRKNIVRDNAISTFKVNEAIGYMANFKRFLPLVSNFLRLEHNLNVEITWIKDIVKESSFSKNKALKKSVEKFKWSQVDFYYLYWNPEIQKYIYTSEPVRFKRKMRDLSIVRETIETLKKNNRSISLMEVSKATGFSINILKELNIKSDLMAARNEIKKQKNIEIAKQLKEEVLNCLSDISDNEKITCSMVYTNLSKKKNWIYERCPDVTNFITRMVYEKNNEKDLFI